MHSICVVDAGIARSAIHITKLYVVHLAD